MNEDIYVNPLGIGWEEPIGEYLHNQRTFKQSRRAIRSTKTCEPCEPFAAGASSGGAWELVLPVALHAWRSYHEHEILSCNGFARSDTPMSSDNVQNTLPSARPLY